MTVITTHDLNKEFNSVVAKYLNDGYILAPIIERARCSQTRSYVSLANPKNKDHILCVWLLNNDERIDNENIRWVSKISIAVKEYKNKSKKTMSFESNILSGFSGSKGSKGSKGIKN